SPFQENLVEVGMRDAGYEPHYVFRSADNGAVISMVRAGLGVALLPRLVVTDELDDPRLAIRELDPAIGNRVIRLAWRKGITLSPAARRFVAIAAEVAAGISRRSAHAAGCSAPPSAAPHAPSARE